MTGVTDKQVKELGIEITPLHPETELRKAGALFESQTAFRDLFATHVVVDDEQRLKKRCFVKTAQFSALKTFKRHFTKQFHGANSDQQVPRNLCIIE